MLILALEQSTPAAGVVLLRDGEVIAAHAWHEARKRDQHLFASLPRLLTAGGVRIEDVDRIAVGLGPGSFSGVRMAIAAASALALPDRRPIAGVSSAAALARHTAHSGRATTVAVVGDARRQRLWMATYECHAAAGTLTAGLPLSLLPTDALYERLPKKCHVVSSDWDRLKECLQPLAEEGWTVAAGPRYPSAPDVAHLASQMAERELLSPLDPPDPLYLHPAVFVKPRFQAP